nr:hypothetical protein [uncultured Marvinbryantia sp.]
MTKFEEIRKIVENFQRKADRCFESYNAEMTRAKNRYSEEAFKIKSAEIWGGAHGNMEYEREQAVNKVSEIIGGIQEDFRGWMTKPISGDLLATLNAIRNFELKLSMPELQILEKEVNGSYFGTRIFSEVARENGYFAKSPDMATFTQGLKRVENNAREAIECYCGCAPDFSGSDLLGEWKVSGVTMGDIPAWRRVFASNYLKTDTSLKDAEKLWGQSQIPAEYKLTKEEEKRIYSIVDNIKDEKAKKDRLAELQTVEPDIVNKIKLMDDEHRAAVEKYLDTGKVGYVSDNNGENIVYP